MKPHFGVKISELLSWENVLAPDPQLMICKVFSSFPPPCFCDNQFNQPTGYLENLLCVGFFIVLIDN